MFLVCLVSLEYVPFQVVATKLIIHSILNKNETDLRSLLTLCLAKCGSEPLVLLGRCGAHTDLQ